MLILAVLAVFVAGLMVGRTPEYLSKKIAAREIKFAPFYILTTPALVLIGTAVAMSSASARSSMLNTGSHGLSEVLYVFTSASNNNGSAFAGISVNTTLLQHGAGAVLCCWAASYPSSSYSALAGSLASPTTGARLHPGDAAHSQAPFVGYGRRRHCSSSSP